MIPNNQVYGCILVSPHNKYLLVQGRSTGKWSFPKGHPNQNEAPLDCARRELFEETGLNAPFMYSNSYQLTTGIYYLYKTRTEDICETLDPTEIVNICWATTTEMKKMNVNIDVNTFLRQRRLCPFPLKGTKPTFLLDSSISSGNNS
jgi:8-oxo-dGTP pyrophosphatase MutT (NUDIX family)